MKRGLLFLLFLTVFFAGGAQQKEIDSILSVLAKHNKDDSVKVKTLNELAYRYNTFNPTKGLITAQHALTLAQHMKYALGESRALRNIAASYRITGNYNKALEILLKQLELDEKNVIPASIASTQMYIGIVYVQQKDYKKALPYYLKSDSVIKVNKLSNLDIYSFNNLGDLYEKIGVLDSAFFFYNKSLNRAIELKNNYFIGATISGLGNCYVKSHNKEKALASYHEALKYLKLADEEDLYCETLLNMARIYEEANQIDSALYFGRTMLHLARKDLFQTRMLDASTFLAGIFKKQKKSDSALSYLEQTTVLKDTLNSLEKIKDFQQKTFNEEVRQTELAEKKRKEEEERSQQLQLLIIGIFIPVFFLLTVFLSKRKIHRKAIQVLGIVSLLLLFEYLTLLLHPFVVELTHHTPIIELLIFVCIAAVLIPGHHRIEHWLVQKLTHFHKNDADHIQIKQSSIDVKKPS